jgi:hypothetical protein
MRACSLFRECSLREDDLRGEYYPLRAPVALPLLAQRRDAISASAETTAVRRKQQRACASAMAPLFDLCRAASSVLSA